MRKAFITGGADGIGFALAKILSKNNYIVYTVDLKTIKEPLQNVEHFVADINDFDKIQTIINQIGQIDLLINNAAVQIEKSFASTSSDEVLKVLNTNIVSTILLTNYSIPFLKDNSLIINVGSVHSNKPRLNKLTYDISKAALDMFTKSLALELAPRVRVNQVNVGATHTPMNEIFKTNPETLKTSISKVPLKHILTANEVAQVIYSLTLETYKHMTGSIILYDAGRSLY